MAGLSSPHGGAVTGFSSPGEPSSGGVRRATEPLPAVSPGGGAAAAVRSRRRRSIRRAESSGGGAAAVVVTGQRRRCCAEPLWAAESRLGEFAGRRSRRWAESQALPPPPDGVAGRRGHRAVSPGGVVAGPSRRAAEPPGGAARCHRRDGPFGIRGSRSVKPSAWRSIPCAGIPRRVCGSKYCILLGSTRCGSPRLRRTQGSTGSPLRVPALR